ncbi:MAG TPA: TIGR02710 family CRISPR-associated CARF protein [Pirellulales bacterium]|nr:TIGR02710 family CRISPR-associated CARF protein [Pirellulales bacterium]
MNQPSILFCTVGTGDIANARDTLLAPLTKSIRAGQWRRVILLPSTLTADSAAQLRTEIADVPIEILPLPGSNLENDTDACFAHFENVIANLRAAGAEPDEMLADFTRGTKAMSAALVLAAVRHGVERLRYISGQRDDRGMVVPGTEQIGDVHTSVVTARQRLDLAARFFEQGDFGAVLAVLPDQATPFASLWPAELLAEARLARPLAVFYAAWDRLDYRAATETALASAPAASRWNRLYPSTRVRGWVATLANDPPEDANQCAAWLRLLAADLLANGERRLRDHQFEDAIIRAYRVLELIGQLRLCDRGIHSDKVPAEDPIVKAFQEELSSKGSRPMEENRKEGGLYASREQVARLLKRFDDPLAKVLLKLGDQGVVSAKRRNVSALIHGFQAVAGSDPDPLRNLYRELEELLLKDGGEEVRERLALARAIDFSRGASSQPRSGDRV